MLAPAAALGATRSGLSIEVLERHRHAIAALGEDLRRAINDYEDAREGKVERQVHASRGEPGLVLILARISKGMSQAEFAEHMGMREQQIQRYEADRYRSISLSNYRRFATALNVKLEASIDPSRAQWQSSPKGLLADFSDEEIAKVANQAAARGWTSKPEETDNPSKTLSDFLVSATPRSAVPAFLRTGLKVNDPVHSLALVAWQTQILRRAEDHLSQVGEFDPLDIDWLGDLVRLSIYPDGPRRAVELLASKGIVVIVEPQLPGLRVDGAAMSFNGIPVIAVTIRYDRVDNFWFTLLHEIAHVFLHWRLGLASGFVDDFDAGDVDEIETEANEFASSALIPPERWRVSPARIASSPAPAEQLAEQLQIHPAIVFGRIRKERGNYSLFSNKVGAGDVRKLFD